MKIASANIEYDDNPPLHILLDEQPHVVSIQQANGVRFRVAGYHLTRAGRSFEGKGVAALTRKDVKVIKTERLRMTAHWTGPKAGRAHNPRVYLALLVEVNGKQAWVICVHWPTHNNAAAQDETAKRLAQFARQHADVPLFIVGDFNREAHELEAFAKAIDGHLVNLGLVDHEVYRGATLHSTRARLAPEGGKWHGWGFATYQIRESA